MVLERTETRRPRPRQKRLHEPPLAKRGGKVNRHLDTRIEESTALVKKLYEESREAQLIRTIPGFGKYLTSGRSRTFFSSSLLLFIRHEPDHKNRSAAHSTIR
jgi:hypothetical protein